MQIKLSQIKQNPDLMQLRTVNDVFVSRYRQAYRQGANFPPIILDQKKYLVSGYHRFQAMLREFGEDHETEAEIKKFKTNRDRLEFFTAENAKHGNPLDGISKKRISIALLKAGATQEDVARLFDVSVQRIIQWGNGSVMVEIGNGRIESKPAKRGLEPPATITETQYQQHIQVDRGLPIKSQITQIIRWLDNGFVADTDTNRELLTSLKKAIEEWGLSCDEEQAA
jgi:hypothetical protein